MASYVRDDLCKRTPLIGQFVRRFHATNVSAHDDDEAHRKDAERNEQNKVLGGADVEEELEQEREMLRIVAYMDRVPMDRKGEEER